MLFNPSSQEYLVCLGVYDWLTNELDAWRRFLSIKWILPSLYQSEKGLCICSSGLRAQFRKTVPNHCLKRIDVGGRSCTSLLLASLRGFGRCRNGIAVLSAAFLSSVPFFVAL